MKSDSLYAWLLRRSVRQWVSLCDWQIPSSLSVSVFVPLCARWADVQQTQVICLWLNPLQSDSLILKSIHPAATHSLSYSFWQRICMCLWLCVLKPACSWCFQLSMDHNEQQIWIVVILQPPRPHVACGCVRRNIFSIICSSLVQLFPLSLT